MNCESTNYILSIVAIGVGIFSFIRDLVHLYDFRFQQSELLTRLEKMQKYLKNELVLDSLSSDDDESEANESEADDDEEADDDDDEEADDDESEANESEADDENDKSKKNTYSNNIIYKFYTTINVPRDLVSEELIQHSDNPDLNYLREKVVADFQEPIVEFLRDNIVSRLQEPPVQDSRLQEPLVQDSRLQEPPVQDQ
jgi:hypothetical protein